MNWKEISEKYPKAWAGLCGWIADTRCRNAFGKYIISLSGIYTCLDYNGKFTFDGKNGWTEFNPRDLFDYFDGLGIIGSVVNYDHSHFCIKWSTSAENETVFHRSDSTRTAAESTLFERMFQIREEQLAHSTSDTRKDNDL